MRDLICSIRKIEAYNTTATEYERKISTGAFLTTEECEKEERNLETKEQEAKKAQMNLEKKKNGGRSMLAPQIIERRIKEIEMPNLKKRSPLLLQMEVQVKKEKNQENLTKKISLLT